MSPYRDNVEAYRARVAELEQELEKMREQQAKPKATPWRASAWWWVTVIYGTALAMANALVLLAPLLPEGIVIVNAVAVVFAAAGAVPWLVDGKPWRGYR